MTTHYLEGGLDVFGTPTNGQVPAWVAAAARAEWATPGSGGLSKVFAALGPISAVDDGQSYNATVHTGLKFDTELFDPDNVYSPTTGFYLVPAGWYFLFTNFTVRPFDAGSVRTGFENSLGQIVSSDDEYRGIAAGTARDRVAHLDIVQSDGVHGIRPFILAAQDGAMDGHGADPGRFGGFRVA